MANESSRYVRWQDYRIKQLTYANNLFLTFSVAALAYWVTLIANEAFRLTELNKEPFFYALIFLSASAVAGTTVVLFRLWNFRFTASTIRDGGNPEKRKVTKILGLCSWSFFHAQVITFVIGIERLTYSVLIAYGYRL